MILKLKIKEKENKKFSLVIDYNFGYILVINKYLCLQICFLNKRTE